MKIFDCTLRDGGNVVGNGFPKDLTLSMIKGLINCGIQDIEFGNAKGIGAAEDKNAPAFLTDLEYMQSVEPYVKKARIGMFCAAKCATKARAEMAAEHGLNFQRVGNNASDGKKSVEAVKLVKAAGLTCRYSLMKAYVSTPEKLAEEAHMLQETGVDKITIMDSAGYMFPDDAAHYVEALKKKVTIPVGFHGHSNLGLSQANAIAAVRAGADEVDGGLLGMARSAGNCATELAVATMHRMGLLPEVDLYKLLDYLDNELIPMMKPHNYEVAVTPQELVLGFAGCHSSYLKTFKKVAEEKKVSLYKLIIEVSKIDKKAPSEALMQEIAAKI